jgi:hypothetical protein
MGITTHITKAVGMQTKATKVEAAVDTKDVGIKVVAVDVTHVAPQHETCPCIVGHMEAVVTSVQAATPQPPGIKLQRLLKTRWVAARVTAHEIWGPK